MIRCLIFYRLKGINGWSIQQKQNIDVANVLDISYHKRVFMLFDRDYPYTLSIKYAIFDEKPPFNKPTYMTKIGEQYITKRYRSEEDVEEDINQIMLKQKQLRTIFTKPKLEQK